MSCGLQTCMIDISCSLLVVMMVYLQRHLYSRVGVHFADLDMNTACPSSSCDRLTFDRPDDLDFDLLTRSFLTVPSSWQVACCHGYREMIERDLGHRVAIFDLRQTVEDDCP